MRLPQVNVGLNTGDVRIEELLRSLLIEAARIAAHADRQVRTQDPDADGCVRVRLQRPNADVMFEYKVTARHATSHLWEPCGPATVELTQIRQHDGWIAGSSPACHRCQ